MDPYWTMNISTIANHVKEIVGGQIFSADNIRGSITLKLNEDSAILVTFNGTEDYNMFMTIVRLDLKVPERCRMLANKRDITFISNQVIAGMIADIIRYNK